MMADKHDSQEDGCTVTPAALFKMLTIQTMPAVSKKDSVQLFEREGESAQLVVPEKCKNGDKDGVPVDSEPDDRETAPIRSKKEKFSPAEELKESESPIPYREPSWGGISDQK